MKVKLIFLISSIWLVFIFLLNPHYVSLGNVLEAWGINRGLILYKDIASFHLFLGRIPPLILYNITSWDLTLTPFLGLSIAFLNIFIIYKFGKIYFSNLATSISIIFFTIYYWYLGTGISFYHEQLISLFLLISIYLLFEIINSKKVLAKNIYLLTAFLILSELSGQVASISVATIALITALVIYRKDKNFSTHFITFTKTVAIILTPILLYFLSKDALWDFIYWNFLYYEDYASLTSSINELPWNLILIFYSPLIASLVVRKKLGILSLINFSTIPFVVFSVFHLHHFTFALPILAITLGFIITYHLKNKLLITILLGINLLYFAQFIIPWHLDRFTFPINLAIRNDIQKGNSDDMLITWLKDNTPKESKILVIGNAMIYVRSDRLPSTRPSHSIPYSWVPFDKVSKEVNEHLPDYLITDSNFTVRLKRDYKIPEMYEFITNLSNTCFTKVYSVDTWIVFKKNVSCHSSK